MKNLEKRYQSEAAKQKQEAKNQVMADAVDKVRDLIKKSGDRILSAVYRTTAATCASEALEPSIKKYWTETADLLAVCDDKDVAKEFVNKFEESIKTLQGNNLLEYLRSVTTGILDIGRRLSSGVSQ